MVHSKGSSRENLPCKRNRSLNAVLFLLIHILGISRSDTVLALNQKLSKYRFIQVLA